MLFSLPGADLEELGTKSYVIAGERGELGSWMPRRWIAVADSEKSLLSGTWALFSSDDLSGVDGRVLKEASIPPQLATWTSTLSQLWSGLLALRMHLPGQG